MGRARSLAFLVVLATLVSACSILPADIARELLPSRTQSTYKMAEFAFNQLIERHVDRPGSRQLLVGALDAVDKQLMADGATAPLQYNRPTFTGSVHSDFAKFASALDQIQDRYMKTAQRTLERVATDGMAKSLNECHTYYLNPDRAKTFNRPPEEYSGIGAQIAATRPNDDPEIAAVFPNSPAEKAGVRAGDRIRQVDGVDVRGFTAEEVATRIRGAEGTTVTLVLGRGSTERTFAITRARLTAPRVIGRSSEDGAIGTVSIIAFNGDVTRQTADAVRSLVNAGAKGIVLDLRNNPGGDLSAAVDVGSIFVKSGVLVNQTGRDGQRSALRTNDRWYWSTPKPLVVLVNERSASGSEIVAAGVRANGVGAVIGNKTAGCVGIGQPRELPDGGLLLITIARMQDAKSGEELNGEGRGVNPDQLVKADPEAGADVQLDAAIAYLRGKIGAS